MHINAYAISTDTAVIHHTASPSWTTVEHIDAWHRARGWDECGYHYVIYTDGSIHKGRPLSKNGAHAKGRNHLLGIALVGYDKFDDKQIISLKLFLKELNVKSIQVHHNLCPGKGINVKELI